MDWIGWVISLMCLGFAGYQFLDSRRIAREASAQADRDKQKRNAASAALVTLKTGLVSCPNSAALVAAVNDTLERLKD